MRAYLRKERGERRPFTSTMGTCNRPNARNRFGHNSVSCTISAPGRRRRPVLRTTHGKSTGNRKTRSACGTTFLRQYLAGRGKRGKHHRPRRKAVVQGGNDRLQTLYLAHGRRVEPQAPLRFPKRKGNAAEALGQVLQVGPRRAGSRHTRYGSEAMPAPMRKRV